VRKAAIRSTAPKIRSEAAARSAVGRARFKARIDRRISFFSIAVSCYFSSKKPRRGFVIPQTIAIFANGKGNSFTKITNFYLL